MILTLVFPKRLISREVRGDIPMRPSTAGVDCEKGDREFILGYRDWKRGGFDELSVEILVVNDTGGIKRTLRCSRTMYERYS